MSGRAGLPRALAYALGAVVVVLALTDYLIFRALEPWCAIGVGVTFNGMIPDAAATKGVTARFLFFLVNHVLIFVLLAVLVSAMRPRAGRAWSVVLSLLLAAGFLVTLNMPFAYLAKKYTKLFAFHPATIYRLNPGFQLRTVVGISSLGFRSGEIAVRKPPGTTRIALVGDSTLFGADMPQQFITSTKLEEALRARFPGRSFEVVNAAVPGQSSAFALPVVRHLLLPVSPDIIVMGYNNDSSPASREDRHYFEGWAPSPPAVACLDYLLRRYGNFLVMARDAYIIEFRSSPPGSGGLPRVSLPDVRANILAVAELCRARGIRLVVLNLPEYLDPRQAKRYAALSPEYRQAARAAAAEARVPFFDVRAGWGTADPSGFQGDGYHLTIKGCGRLADDLAAYLAGSGLVGK